MRPDQLLSTLSLDTQVVVDLDARFAEREQPALIVRDGGGVRAVPLLDGGIRVVGRSAPADVVISDPSLSREHAAFEVEGTQVYVEDLDSTNGVFVNGARVTARTAVSVGDRVLLGRVAVGVHLLDDRGAAAHQLEGHDRFCERLAVEVVRARDYQRPLSLLMVIADAGALEAVVPALRKALEVYQTPGYYGAGVVEVLLPECDAAAARAVAERLVERVADGGARLRVGVGSVPACAGSGEALIGVTLAAARGGDPVALAPAQGTHQAGEAGETLSEAMRALDDLVERVSDASVPLLIHGETGAGKEVVARRIHAGSRRAERPMVCVNCGAIPDQLLESTLFGHEKGAFTGATAASRGVFEAANGGTVFLDEIGELPPQAQVALLRVLENKRYTRVGSTQEREADVRVLAATHRDLEALCRDGTFRWDLYYRLNVMTLEVPPLRDRRDDIRTLAGSFLAAANAANHRQVSGIDEAAFAALERYRWPGNVRELRNAVERAVVVTRGATVAVEDLPPRVLRAALGSIAAEEQAASTPTQAHAAVQRAAAVSSREPPGAVEASNTDDETPGADLRTRMHAFEARLLQDALERADGRRADAARLLGLPVRTLAYKIKQHGLD